MAAFSLARRLRAGETVFSAWCTLASPLAAETVAREGFGAVVLDMQHGLWDTAALIAGIGALHHAGSAAVVRVPLNDFAMVPRPESASLRLAEREAFILTPDIQRRVCSCERRG